MENYFKNWRLTAILIECGDCSRETFDIYHIKVLISWNNCCIVLFSWRCSECLTTSTRHRKTFHYKIHSEVKQCLSSYYGELTGFIEPGRISTCKRISGRKIRDTWNEIPYHTLQYQASHIYGEHSEYLEEGDLWLVIELISFHFPSK